MERTEGERLGGEMERTEGGRLGGEMERAERGRLGRAEDRQLGRITENGIVHRANETEGLKDFCTYRTEDLQKTKGQGGESTL